MTTKSEWQPIHDAMMERDRGRLGEPPTAEEMLAYRRGELSAQDEARVREQLVLYPELARAVAQTSLDDPRPGDPDFLSEEELGVHWQSLQKRIHGNRPEGGRVLQFWRISAALAAMLAVVFGSQLWKARSELGQPVRTVIWEKQELSPGGTRGPSDEVTLRMPKGEELSVELMLLSESQFAGYRVELLDLNGAEPPLVYEDTHLTATEQETVEVILRPRALQAGGRYEFVLYGVDGGREERLGTYRFRVPTS